MYRLSPKAAGLIPYEPIVGHYRIRLDANESFLLPTPEDREKMAAAAAEVALNRYPDPAAASLCEAFAALYGVDPALVTAGNGSDELISLLLSAFIMKGEKVLTLTPDFSMYAFYASLCEADAVTLKKNDDLTIDVDRMIDRIRQESIRMVLFSNPCNPTSLGLNKPEVLRLLRETDGTDCLIVVDEAYMDFWDQSVLSEVSGEERLIVLRTCSKALGLAALRVGFAVAPPALTRVIRAAKSPYNCDAVTQEMARVVLQNPVYHTVYPPLLLASRDMLLDGLKALCEEGWIETVFDSCTNFVLIRLKDARRVAEQLRERGIVVRLLNDEYLRITAGTQAENQELIDTLRVLTGGGSACGCCEKA